MSVNVLERIPDNVIKAVRRLIECLLENGFHIEKIFLFGSYAKGTWLKTSDIDLVIVSSDFQNIPFKERLDLINKIVFKENIIPYIEVLPYTPDEFSRKIKESIVLRDASRYWIDLTSIILSTK